MKHIPTCVAIAIAVVAMGMLGCASTAPAPLPTQSPASPAKTEPTKAPAAAPATAPTKAPAAASTTAPTMAPAAASTTAPTKVAFPEKGKPITIIVPWPAGGTIDGPARALASMLEKDLGTPVNVINRDGAASQVGLTELALAKPDGYTIGYSNLPSLILIYLDPARKSAFTRQSFEPIALHMGDAGVIAVRADSPYKTIVDMVDAAKAKPATIKIGTSGLMSSGHLRLLTLERVAQVKFALVHFTGGAPSQTALMGGHIDGHMAHIGATIVAPVKNGEIRVLGVMGKEESELLPGVKTMEAMGYPVYSYTLNGLYAPAGTPKEILDILDKAVAKAAGTEEVKRALAAFGSTTRYRNREQFATLWTEEEAELRPLWEAAKAAKP